MAAPKRIVYSPESIDELDQIWQWNAKIYSVSHADRYLAYLQRCIDTLRRGDRNGKQVAARLDLRYILIRQRATGHGHIAVYKVDDRTIEILHIFHTAQDWQGTLSTDIP